ncbi:hypothetical protein FRX31_028493, partial [Thalictrum thalictroides]
MSTMSDSATDSQNVSDREIEDEIEMSSNSEVSVSNNADEIEVSSINVDDINFDNEVDSSEHISPEQARVAFPNIRLAYNIKITDLE